MASALEPMAKPDLVFAESGGRVAFEAEHFILQEKADPRAWYVIRPESMPAHKPDADRPHLRDTSGGAYVEIQPDTRMTHDDTLIVGQNFENRQGRMAVLTYRVHFQTTGRYYVWLRAYATGAEDDSVHVGLDGTWPASGWAWSTPRKHAWHWDSRQLPNHDTGERGGEGKLYLDVAEAGGHTFQLSMREDGVEIDKIVLTTDPAYRPEGTGPEPVVHAGRLPAPFVVPEDVEEGHLPLPPDAVVVDATSLPIEGTGFYLHDRTWLAVDPGRAAEGRIRFRLPVAPGLYDITLQGVGEHAGRATYTLRVGGRALAPFSPPQARHYLFEEGPHTARTWHGVAVGAGDEAELLAVPGSVDGHVHARARWRLLALTPAVPRPAHGDGAVRVTGDLRQWHKVTLDLSGPFADERDGFPNPATDHAFAVEFTHASGAHSYRVPGYFATDGRAAETGATSGTTWRAHLSPDAPGRWTYRVHFTLGSMAAIGEPGAVPLAPYHGVSGSFEVAPTDKSGRDFRAHGRLQYQGQHHLRFAGSGEWFFKVGTDAPETLLGYADFDGTEQRRRHVPLKTFAPHVRDWRPGDPVWRGDRGRGLIGALNYLASKGLNGFSFLTYNAGGDGDNVWPYVSRNDTFHFDSSKLDQWGIVFDHATAQGLHLHFKLQETENDDGRFENARKPREIPTALDGGDVGPERRVYLRQLIARYGHALALTWNLGEENTQTPEEQRAMAAWLAATDPYHHPIVIHSYPEDLERVYPPLLGLQSALTGASIQTDWAEVHQKTLRWVHASRMAYTRPWVVANDEQGPHTHGVPPDPGYQGFPGVADDGRRPVDLHGIRKYTLWGNLMAGGAGVEYYFGYKLPQSDLNAEDFRSRDRSWDYCRIAHAFLREEKIPFWEMRNDDARVGNPAGDNSRYCLAKRNELYLVYLPDGGAAALDLTDVEGRFAVSWFNPRRGGESIPGPAEISGRQSIELGPPPAEATDDWLVIVRRRDG